MLVMFSEAIFYIIFGYLVYLTITLGTQKTMARSQALSFLLMPSFTVLLLADQDKHLNLSARPKKENILRILCNILSVFVVLLFLYKLKIFVNKVETRKMLRKSRHHLGPGLARTFFSFLEMLPKCQNGTPGLHKILSNYAQDERIHIYNKVLILFPRNTSQDVGSHAWMVKKEKDYNSDTHLATHGHVEFTFQGTIHHSYFCNGKNRDIELAVIKIRNNQTNKVFYVPVAENRALITLQKMLGLTVLGWEFNEDDFQLQSEIYKKSLTSLVEEDSECNQCFEIVDMQRSNGEFPLKIYNLVATEVNEITQQA